MVAQLGRPSGYSLLTGRPERVLVSSFYRLETRSPDVEIIPPLLRDEVHQADAISGEHLLVYLNQQLLINLHPHEPATLRLEMPGEQAWYRVTAPSLDSREVRLNGARLALVGEALPELARKHGSVWSKHGPALVVPRSYAFTVVEAAAEACP